MIVESHSPPRGATRRRPPLRIGILAPPWVSVPPTSYGGTELILDVLSRGLQELGHELVLFTTADSTCDVPKRWLFESSDPDRMGAAVLELRHVAAAYDVFAGFDIVHDHTLVGPFLAPLHPTLPVVTTVHGPFDDDLVDIYRRTAHTVPTIAISEDRASRAPLDIPIGAVIHHGLDLDRYRFDEVGGDYLVALGRMNPDKGIHVAIEVARRLGVDLVIAAKMREPAEKRYFESVVRPLLGNGVEYVGEVDHDAKVDLLAGARALLNPIQWPEPFGLVMVEALACGTPVVATPAGAAPEIIRPGATGYLAATADELLSGVMACADLDRKVCRAEMEQRFSMATMARNHEAFYRSVLAQRSGRRRWPGGSRPSPGLTGPVRARRPPRAAKRR